MVWGGLGVRVTNRFTCSKSIKISQMAATAEQMTQDSYIDKLKTSIELIEAIKAENDMYKENFEQAGGETSDFRCC
jgi:hypothetical protein